MNPRILVAHTTHCARIDASRVKILAAFFLDCAESAKVRLESLSIAIVDDADIAPLNKRFMRHAGPTDVISFLLAPPPGADLESGEVIVNAEQALREARRRRGNPARELAWYLAHGIHHLAGADDRTPAQRSAMHRIEKRWLASAAKAGLIDRLMEIRA